MSTTTLWNLIREPDYDLKVVTHKNRFRGLWRLLYGYRWLYIIATVALGLAALAKTSTLLLLRFFIDDVLMQANPILLESLPGQQLTERAIVSGQAASEISGGSVSLSIILLIGLGFILLALAEGFFTFTSGRMAAQTAEGVAHRLRNYLFDHIQRLNFVYHDKNQTGDTLQRCTSDVDAVRRFFAEQAIGVGRIILLFVTNFLVIMTIDWRLSLFSALVVPIVVVVSFFFFKRVSQRYEAFQEQEAVMSTRLQENLSGVRVVKAFARQQYEIDKFEHENWEHFQRGRRLVIMHSFFWPMIDVLTGLQLLAAYFIGALFVINGQMTVGAYIAFAGMVIYIIFPMRNLGRLIVQMSTGLVSFDRVAEVIREDREPLGEDDAAPVDELQGKVEFKQVNFAYSPDIPVLKNVNFDVNPGQVIALMGATGSGKSTIVNLLPRFYELTDGQILLDGIDLQDYPRDFLRRNIGIVEQEPFLFSRSIRENITYGVGREVSDEELFRAAKAAAIHHVIESFPDGYNTMVGERGVTLSGGQKQRVTVARTLLKNPRILILDDATSSVDTETEAAIRTALKELLPGRTSFIIAHRIQTVMSADMIVVFDHGEIIQMGTHDELIQDLDGVYRQIFEMQSRIDAELEREISGE